MKFWIILAALICLLVSGVLILALPWAIHTLSVYQLEEMTGHTVTLEDVSLDYVDRRITLTGFALQEPQSNESLVTVDRLQVQFRLWPLLRKHLILPAVIVDHPVVSLVKESDGTLNLSRLKKEEASPSEPSEFVTTVENLTLNDGTLRYQDFTNPAHPQVRADGISLEIANFSTQGTEPIPVALQGTLAKKGFLSAKGQIQLDPFVLESQWDIQKVHLSPYQDFTPGFPPFSGTVDSSFSLRVPSEGFSSVRVTGKVAINDFSVGAQPNPFLTGQRITVEDIEYSGPDVVKIAHVKIQEVSLEILRDEQGTLPVLAYFQKKTPDGPALEEESSSSKAGLKPHIGEIQLQDGRIIFIDQAIQPEYRKELTQVMVAMNQLTSEAGQMGRVTLTASSPDDEFIALEGDIKLFGGEFYLDIGGEVKQFSIPAFNPYAEKFLGWGTKSGQLTTDLHVHIEEQQLQSKSKIGISDLRVVRAGTDDLVNKTLGMPLGLVVDLIKNINGDIKLKVEVDGPLNKPEFSIGNAIWKSIRNAIVNIVTAPLRLIGRLVKRGDKIQTVEIDPILFKAGTKTMTKGMEKRLTDFQRFLKKTPYVGLQIQPVISEKDRHMLRIRAVTSRIAQLEAEQSLSKGPEAAQMLYRETFPGQTPPAEEVALLEKLVENEPEPTEHMSALASERAKIVVDRLSASAGISKTRLHVAEYKQGPDDEDVGGIEFSMTR